MKEHEKIQYVEFPAGDLDAIKQFYTEVFGWEFQDFGPDYCAFGDEGIEGGFYRSELNSSSDAGGALIVFFSEDLEATQEKVIGGGGKIHKPIFEFPGGRRFHFLDPCNNELAVWSDSACPEMAVLP